MGNREYNFLFGPVPSRRLGRSLGVDLVPIKTCSFDCIYCQLGRTTDKRIERREFSPLGDVLAELHARIREGKEADYITLSGSGEPTLYSKLHDLILAVKELTEIPVAVLTNGSLLHHSKVRCALQEADLVIPSLDAGDSLTFSTVNRPHADVSFEKMLEGFVDFRSGFSGRIWLEVFLVEGISAISSEVEKIRSHVERIQPDRVQLNTSTRPPAEAFALPVSKDRMLRFARMLGDNAEVIVDFKENQRRFNGSLSREAVLNLLRRRPCSLADVSRGLAMHPNEALKYLGALVEDGKIIIRALRGKNFYVVKQ